MARFDVHMESTAMVRGNIVVEASSMEEAEKIAKAEALIGANTLWVAVGRVGEITAPVIYNYDTGQRVRP